LIAVLTNTPIELRFWSAVGVPSITSLALLGDVALRRHGATLLPDRSLVLAIAAAAFVIVVPAALGFVPLDIYRIGFSPFAPVVLAIVAIFLRPTAALVILVALIAFDFRLLGSTNLWDYVVDPIGGVIAVAALVAAYTGRIPRTDGSSALAWKDIGVDQANAR
jgi:hypothetical protein